ncbi:unnamed protein product, partial [Heterosigma akashiwo]
EGHGHVAAAGRGAGGAAGGRGHGRRAGQDLPVAADDERLPGRAGGPGPGLRGRLPRLGLLPSLPYGLTTPAAMIEDGVCDYGQRQQHLNPRTSSFLFLLLLAVVFSQYAAIYEFWRQFLICICYGCHVASARGGCLVQASSFFLISII